MAGLLFGTGGVPHSAKTRSTVDGIRRIAELGLDCLEIEFVQGVKMGEASAREVARVAAEKGVRLSAHAPYFINLNAREPVKIEASQQRLLQAARIGALCGAWSIVFHAAFYMGDSPEKTYVMVKKYLSEVLAQLKKEKNQVCVRPEVMGKGSEFGTIDEVLRLSTELEGVAPCVDFAHWHARTGKFNSYPEFVSTLRQVKEWLGQTGLDNMHIHFSGIKYGTRGEISHLNLKDADLRYEELLRAFRDLAVKGLVICESPNLEEDALLLKETYQRLLKAG